MTTKWLVDCGIASCPFRGVEHIGHGMSAARANLSATEYAALLRKALERCHYWGARAHDPAFDHGHPIPVPDGKWCGLCAAISDCETCAILRAAIGNKS